MIEEMNAAIFFINNTFTQRMCLFCIYNVARRPMLFYNTDKEVFNMAKNVSISIRVSDEELNRFKQAARLEKYASYSEFIRRTALLEASRVLGENEGAVDYDRNNK